MYIGDNLRVGVRPQPGNTAAPTAVITSGTVITILQKTPDYVRIRTEDGVEGWIRDDYISDMPPARLRLNQLEEENQQLKQKVQKLQYELDHNDEGKAALTQKIRMLNEEIFSLHQKVATLRPDSNKAWIYIIIATLSLCGLTFTLGILWNKQQVAKKLGGHSL